MSVQSGNTAEAAHGGDWAYRWVAGKYVQYMLDL